MRGDAAASVVLAAGLQELEDCWLELHCCHRTALLPLRLLASRYGQECRLGDILLRMRCQLCKGKPVRAYLNEAANRTACYGAPPGWSIQLIPDPGTALD